MTLHYRKLGVVVIAAADYTAPAVYATLNIQALVR